VRFAQKYTTVFKSTIRPEKVSLPQLPNKPMANLLEELFVNLLDMQSLLDNATDTMQNHQSSELAPTV
jgi:hypothetical protein